MSGLAALVAGHNPPDVYRWHSATHVEDVQHAAETAGWTFAYLDGWTIEDASTFRKAVVTSCGLDDAAADSMESLEAALSGHSPEGSGMVLLWDGWSPLARHDEAAFNDVIALFQRRTDAGAFAAVLRGDGPDLEIPELPIKHD
jgi:hypothetical protein